MKYFFKKEQILLKIPESYILNIMENLLLKLFYTLRFYTYILQPEPKLPKIAQVIKYN